MTDDTTGNSSSWSDRLATPRAVHSHRPVRDIQRDLNISGLERAFLWLSKTDFYVLSLCPYSTRLTLSALGMMVLFTTLLAFGSSLYTVKTAVIGPDQPFGWPIGVLLAGIYAFGIMIIDREIVGAATTKALWIRVVFALLIAVAVSYPVKMRFFEGRIDNEVSEMIEENNRDKLLRIEELRSTGESERLEQRAAISSRIASLDQEIGIMDLEIAREQQDIECGPRCQEFRSQKEELMQRRIAAEEQLANLSGPSPLPPEIQAQVDSLQAQVDSARASSFDLLTKWEAMGRIKEDVGSSYHIISSFILIFFILLELVPVGLKWSLGKTEYHYYIQARTEVNNTKIVSIANVFIAQMEANPENALKTVPIEVSDIIARVLEDESVLESANPDPSSFSDLHGLSTNDGRAASQPPRSDPNPDPSSTRKE